MTLPFSHPGSGHGEPGLEYDARPKVAIDRRDRSPWLFAGGALMAAALLFSALEARRQGSEHATSQSTTSLAAPETLPEFVVPSLPAEQSHALVGQDGWPEPANRRPLGVASVAQPQTPLGVDRPVYQPQEGYGDTSYQLPPPPSPSQQGTLARSFEAAPSPNGTASGLGTNRILADRLENPATTVVQGTLINAVLETALDSTRPGQTRAVVTRDVYGFDGKRLLVPRGTRLYGSYEADLAQGQKRAQLRWTRLLRPDGVSVALDSPAADPLGRAGVAGKVDNHFFERLGNALIGTTANVGSALMTRNIATPSPVIVAVPGATQTVSQTFAPRATQIMPTLRVRQGTRITVFVQHDLDFSSVERDD